MKMKQTRLHIIRFFALLLLFCGTANEAWAYKITYHILTLPMTSTKPGNTKSDYYGWRMEAIKVVVDGVTTVRPLPDHFQSPLAKNFKYYADNASSIEKDGTAREIYANHPQNKYFLYKIKGEDTPADATDDATPLSIGAAITSNCDIYVTYDYDDSKDIKLNGSESYNIVIHGGFLAFNKGRNNRLAVIPEKYNDEYIVSGEQLCSNDFVKVDLNGKNTGITTWWNGNKTPRATADSYFHFLFKYEGEDPYNITIRTAYNGDDCYYEKYGSEPKEIKRYYKWASVFTATKQADDNLLIASDDNRHYTTLYDSGNDVAYEDMPGYYRAINTHIWNSFVLLNNSNNDGYVYMGTRCVDSNGNLRDPSDNKFYYLKADNNALTFSLMTAETATSKYSTDDEMYEVVTYTFNVTTPFGNTVSATKEWTEAYNDVEIQTSHVPASLRRKYCGIVGFYSDAGLTQKITKYSQATEGNIYIKYEVSGAPFTAIDPSADYTTATWYELTDAGSDQSSGKKLKWDGSSAFKNNGANEAYDKLSEFAFVGDPYELRVLYRDATETAPGKCYVGAATVSAGNALGFSATDDAGYKWEIPYDDTAGSFLLQQYGSSANTPMYWQWTTASADNSVTINTTSTRVKVMKLPTFTYTYNVVDLAGNIAIQATAEQTIFSNLNGYASIPASIRSPFLADEIITFYDSYTDRNYDGKTNRLDWHNDTSGASEQTPITQAPGTNNANIYVAYTTKALSSKSIQLIYSQEFNVKLNGEYIYWNSAAGVDQNKILSENLSADDAKLATTPYLWHLRGRDPYSMRIDNRGYTENQSLGTISVDIYNTAGDGTSTSQTVNNGMFVKVHEDTWDDGQALDFVSVRDNASRFIAMLSNSGGVYEVLAATGSTDYYRIGRVSTAGAETKIYANSTYAHGAEQLRFELASTTLVSYHLIDKSGAEIFTGEISSKNPRLTLPADYVSPLVEEYYYYPTSAKASKDLAGDRITEISQDTNEEGGSADHHVYVTYKVSDAIGFGTSHPHMLKFYNGASYHMEDGFDKLTTGDKIKAVYPYCNGDGNLNIYGSAMNEEQMAGGANTRPRWVWYFESDNSDPYHVKIHSKSTISFNGAPNTTYIQTYAVHFDQETDAPNKQRIVTGANFPGISGNAATEYAIMGVAGRYKLLTINKIAADLNGDGDKTDDGENERRYVTSFEQYWKTYNMVRQDVLGDDRVDKNDPDRFNDPIIMPSGRWSELKEKLTAKGVNDAANRVDDCSWHSYEAIANATRWNGYSDVSDGYEKKKVERLQHWFQTFDMGDGTFDIESADIPSVLVLLDRHGWEIMRKPIPTGSGDADAEAKLADLRAYDSPMVKEYKFYSNATKASGCHKYSLRLNDDGTDKDPINVNGKQFTSISLATLPTYKADRDLYVTYTVKEEYDKSYDPSTPTASKFLILQNHEFASDGGESSIAKTTAPSSLSSEIIADVDKEEVAKTFKQNTLWFVQPNPNIDDEMGYPGDAVSYTDDQNGFDPYNIQLKNVSTSKFFTTHMTDSELKGGAYIGDYTGSGGNLNVTLAEGSAGTRANSESYDHTHLMMTNQTFMAVQDVNLNMQLMPRFDHSRRIEGFATLEEPKIHATDGIDDVSPGEQTTFMVRPVVHDYRIIDNDGYVAMRYRTGGEFYPTMPEHFKSPLAKNFKYYKTLEDSNSDGVYELGTLAGEITSSFGAAEVAYDANGKADIFIRYEYDETSDTEHDYILQGRWMTMSLCSSGGDEQWVYYNGTLNTSGAGLYTTTKPSSSPTDELSSERQWQWKFLQSPCVSTLPSGEANPYYVAPDPYAVRISNREANKADADMATGIKVGTTDRFVLLSHSDGDYALASQSDSYASYSFLSGDGMTAHDASTPKPASIATEAGFTTTANTLTAAVKVKFANDIQHNYTYNIINNVYHLAAHETQNMETALSNSFEPVVPTNIQSPLINDVDYLFYGTATESSGTYTIDTQSQLDNLFGLYDDVVYVRYPAFDRDKTPYLVPNVRNGESPVAVSSSSNDVAIEINGNLPYNIIWLSDNMMTSADGTNISDKGTNSYQLSADAADMWKFEGNDPYAIQIRHRDDGHYIDGTSTLKESTTKTYMLLKKADYYYGVFAETGNQENMLTYSSGLSTTTSTPTKFIPFALSVYHLIYHLVIAKTCPNKEDPQSGEYVDIPYRTGDENTYTTANTWLDSDVTRIYGTTQRNLSTTYQLGETVNGQDYSHDAGKVSIGDEMDVPSCFYRPNCNYLYYIEGVYDNVECTTPNTNLNNKYKGLEVTKLMSDAALIGKTVRVNVAYGFAGGLKTNAGDGFVTSVNQNLWYTFETNGSTPYLAHYTNAWGLQCMEGRETRYTNDYLWTPLGDPYGFKMYNRYVKKNSSTTGDDDSRVMTTESFTEGKTLKMAVPGGTITDEEGHENVPVPEGNEVYELLAEETTTPGYFLIHPVINNEGTQYYVKKDASDDYAKLDTRANATEWKFGLSPLLIQPYFDCVGYPGGLEQAVYDELKANEYGNEDPKKDLLEAFTKGTATAAQLMTLQSIVYDTRNIVEFATGYYRMHNQPGVSGISPVRYASGYLHEIEKTAVSGGIPMHFYSRVNSSSTLTFEGEGGLGSGFTETPATRGAIPVPATEYDPSTIFYINGSTATNKTISTATMSTQGLNVLGNKMTTSTGTTFTLMDIGGAVFLITDILNPKIRNYLNFDQTYEESSVKMIYDLKFTQEVPTDDAKWCLEPANKQGLMLTTNDGGDGYFYSTFFAPFDVLMPTDEGTNIYYAYVCDAWDTEIIHPNKVPEKIISEKTYPAGEFVPAGTPVIIRTTDNTGKIKLTLPTDAPTTPAVTCIFTGKYLEQLLATEVTAEDKVYAFGLPITGYTGVTTTSGATNGEIENPVGRDQADKGVGFYINATQNKEKGEESGLWTPNNRYVIHNKIYYRAGSSGAGTRGVEFVPVIFGDEEEEKLPGIQDENDYRGDGCVYDLMGRKVATRQQVIDGTWRNHLTSGIYIINGKKIIVK